MQHLQPNTTLQGGKYRIERVLGQGGFGITYLATLISSNRQVAIKELFLYGVNERTGNSIRVSNSVNDSLFEKQKEKFKKEAKRIMSLDNEHIVKVYDLFEENNTVYYVMDYVDGETLYDLMKRNDSPMTELEVKRLLPQILDALKSIHNASILYLDLKPMNIMINKSGKMILVDFVASKQFNLNNFSKVDEEGMFYTPCYSPREQIELDLDNIGPWSDIYALGATLYNLLTNKRPPSPSDIDSDESDDKHVSLPLFNISRGMKHFILLMMKTNWTQRPQTINELSLMMQNELYGIDNQNKNMQQLQTGTTLQGGKYRIERVLGQGGFGITYLAEQVSLGRRVAVKELFIGGNGQAINGRRGYQVVVTNAVNQQSFNQQKEKFKKEALRLANLNHPNLPKVHDFFEENETAYYVMEYIDGESLRTRLNRKGSLSEAQVMNYFKQLLEALSVAHQQNIWHLDIKPENIMIDRYDNAYLIDFGASKHINRCSALTTSLSLAYTPGYCPPELLDLSNETPEYYIQAIKDIGPWTDIYALGATIYNLLTDSIPPSKRRLEKEGRNAFMFPSNISSSTKDMIVLMMKPNLEDRPQSVKEIIVFLNDKALYESNDNIPILMSEDNQTHPNPNFIIIDKNEPNKQEKTLYDTNKELLMSFNINDITINYDIVDPNLFYKFFKIYNNQLQSNERIYIEDIVRKTKNSIEIILVNIGWWLKGGMVKNLYVKQTMTHISAEVAGFSAGDVYSALSLAERALTFAGIVKGANISPAKVLLGIGWLLREGKVHLANNRIGL